MSYTQEMGKRENLSEVGSATTNSKNDNNDNEK